MSDEDTADAWWAQQDNEEWHKHVLLAQKFRTRIDRQRLLTKTQGNET